MSSLKEIELLEKEYAQCTVPLDIYELNQTDVKLPLNQIGVFIPKLMKNFSSREPADVKEMLDFSMIKNMKHVNHLIESCNYIIAEPYKDQNISFPIFSRFETCVVRFIHKDIKQCFFTAENDNNTAEEFRKNDRRVISVVDDLTGKYEVILDTFEGVIEIKTDNKNFGKYQNSIKIEQKDDKITLTTGETFVSLTPDQISLNEMVVIDVKGDITITPKENVVIEAKEVNIEAKDVNITSDTLKLDSQEVTINSENVELTTQEASINSENMNLNAQEIGISV